MENLTRGTGDRRFSDQREQGPASDEEQRPFSAHRGGHPPPGFEQLGEPLHRNQPARYESDPLAGSEIPAKLLTRLLAKISAKGLAARFCPQPRSDLFDGIEVADVGGVEQAIGRYPQGLEDLPGLASHADHRIGLGQQNPAKRAPNRTRGCRTDAGVVAPDHQWNAPELAEEQRYQRAGSEL